MNLKFRGKACVVFLLFIHLIFIPATALAQFSIGFASNEGNASISPEAAAEFCKYLTKESAFQVEAKSFKTEQQLLKWLTIFREVDFAWLPKTTLDQIPIGEFYILARNPGEASLPQGGIVASQKVRGDVREQLSSILISMAQASAGSEILNSLNISQFEKPLTPKRVPTRTFTATGEQHKQPDETRANQQEELTAPKSNIPVTTARQIPTATPPGPAPSQPAKGSVRRTRPAPEVAPLKQLVAGFAADSKGLKKSNEATEEISLYLQEQLSLPIKTRRFDTEETLYRWLSQFREVDIAWLSNSRLETLPVGELAFLAVDQGAAKNTSGKMVSHQGVSRSLQAEIGQALEKLGQTIEGKELLSQLGITHFMAVQKGPVSPPSKRVSRITPKAAGQKPGQKAEEASRKSLPLVPVKIKTKQKPITVTHPKQQSKTITPKISAPGGAVNRKETPSKPRSTQKTKRQVVAKQKSSKQKQLVLGLAKNSKELKDANIAAEELSLYLQKKLTTPVKSRVFDTEDNLYRWLHQFREVDIAWLSTDRVSTRPVGELIQLAVETSTPKDKASGIMVTHQGMNSASQEAISLALLELKQGFGEHNILAQMGVDKFLSPTQNSPAPSPKKQALPTETVAIATKQKDQDVPAEAQALEQPHVEEQHKPVVAVEHNEEQPNQTLPSLPVAPVAIEKIELAEKVVPPQAADEPEKQSSPFSAPAEVSVSAKEKKTLEFPLASKPNKHSLSKLFGTNEVPVLTSASESFIKNMAGTQMFGDDLTKRIDRTNLSDSIHAGRTFSRESLAAEARVDQAKAQSGQAFGLLLPQVTVRTAYGSETSEPGVEIDETTGELIESDKHERTDASLTVRQTLFDLPRYFDWRKRQVTERAREENQRISDGDAYLATIDSYLSLVSSRLQADVTRSFEDQLAELLEYIEKRASAGAASISDMARVRARIQATLSSRLEQEAAHATAGIEFVRLTNVAPTSVRMPEPKDIGKDSLPGTFDQAVETAMLSNPEIQTLAAELKAAKIDMKAAKSRYYPRLDAEYTDTYSLGAGGSKDKNGQRDMRLMAVLNWELFSGGKNRQYNIERAARHKELQYRLDDQRRRVVETLSANYTALEIARERLATSYEELESISTAADAMSKRMLSGKQSLLDLLDVYDRYYQVRSRLVNLHILEMNTISQLIRLTHGAPWNRDNDS